MKTQKQKIFILILIATIAIIGSVLVKRNKIENQYLSAVNVKLTNPDNTRAMKNDAVGLLALEGSIANIQKDSIEIQNGEVKNTLSLIENPYIFQIQDGKATKKKLTDLKQGARVKINVRQSDSGVVSVEIEN